MAMFLLGGVSGAELVSLLLVPCFFIIALMTPFFGAQRVQENADGYGHHLVLSGALIAGAGAFVLFTHFSSLAFLVLAVPNAFWFLTALSAQRRAQQRKDEEP